MVYIKYFVEMKKNNIPRFSILVPIYNVEQYIYRCIDSILAQTFTNFECILVNDCSPDNSPKICDEYAKKDSRIKTIHKLQNEGLPQARKTAFEHSIGDYIIFVDSDDWIEFNMLNIINSYLENDVDMAVFDYYLEYSKNYVYVIHTIDTINLINNMGFVHSPNVWSKIYKREIIEKIIFPKASKYEDRCITQQALFFSNKIVKIPYPLYHYFQNPVSLTRNISVNAFLEWQENIIFVYNFLRTNLNELYNEKSKNINTYINGFKFKVLKNKILRKEKKLLFFIPESNFYRWLILLLFNKFIHYILPGIFSKKYES